jgi:hypothetical protein
MKKKSIVWIMAMPLISIQCKWIFNQNGKLKMIHGDFSAELHGRGGMRVGSNVYYLVER